MKNILILSTLFLSMGLLSCKKEDTPVRSEPKIFHNVLILGNSITYMPENDGIGWTGSRGMASSAPEFDYVHILTAQLMTKDPLVKMCARNISDFERGYNDFNLNKLDSLRSLKPDLIIIRIGENIAQKDMNIPTFEKRYTDLLNFLKVGNPNVRVLAVGSYYRNEPVDIVMYQHSDFITLKYLGDDPTNSAWGEYTDSGVASHPSDKGMKAIAGLIWDKIETLK